ncbi:hypothetical protein [Halobaculum marinum]|uniref:Uncharacterized protein n=1 Tax=Halobaculum marinum TaxID=3031996 RepID=A0ABD5WVC2_9EURY|nr:hypothetical protein [Halobaculum sp. DT55]
MGGIVSGTPGRLVGAAMALSASVSVPALPYVSDLATDWGVAAAPVVVLVALFVAVRLVLGVALVVRDDGDTLSDPLAFGRETEGSASERSVLSRLRSRR